MVQHIGKSIIYYNTNLHQVTQICVCRGHKQAQEAH